MAAIGPTWEQIAMKYGLSEPRVEKLVSWWHTDGDLGREIECVNDITKSRILGFTAFESTPASFFQLFDRLKSDKIIPA